MIAKKMSPKYAELTVHSKEVALMLHALEKMEQSAITKHFSKELRRMEETLKILLDEMVI